VIAGVGLKDVSCDEFTPLDGFILVFFKGDSKCKNVKGY
jgi:hypothetical protein